MYMVVILTVMIILIVLLSNLMMINAKSIISIYIKEIISYTHNKLEDVGSRIILDHIKARPTLVR